MTVYVQMSILVETPFDSVEEATNHINDLNGVSGLKLLYKNNRGEKSYKLADYHIDDYIKDESNDEE